MHEHGVAEAVLAAVERRAAGRPVRRAKVRVGVLLRISETALNEAFVTISDDTVAEGAHLDVITEPVRLVCGVCDRTITSEGLLASCPVCGATGLAIEGGDDLVLESIQLAETACTPRSSPRDRADRTESP